VRGLFVPASSERLLQDHPSGSARAATLTVNLRSVMHRDIRDSAWLTAYPKYDCVLFPEVSFAGQWHCTFPSFAIPRPGGCRTVCLLWPKVQCSEGALPQLTPPYHLRRDRIDKVLGECLEAWRQSHRSGSAC